MTLLTFSAPEVDGLEAGGNKGLFVGSGLMVGEGNEGLFVGLGLVVGEGNKGLFVGLGGGKGVLVTAGTIGAPAAGKVGSKTSPITHCSASAKMVILQQGQ